AVVAIDGRDEMPVGTGHDAFSVSARNREPALRIQRDFRRTAQHRWRGGAIPAHFLPLRDTMRHPLSAVNRTQLTLLRSRRTRDERAGKLAATASRAHA